MSTTSTQTATDREQLIALLKKSAERYRGALASIPEEAAGAKLRDECWSILQIAEHVAAAEHGMFRALELAAEKTSPPNFEIDRRIAANGTNREFKRQAPEPSLPKGRWKTISECAEAFKKSRARTIEYLSSTDDLRKKLIVHPLLGELDGYQMVLVMAGHPERHALQIEEIKVTN